MKRSASILSLACILLVFVGCGSASPVPPTSLPVPIEDLEGRSDIEVDANFEYEFVKDVDTETVTETTFFIEETATDASDRCDADHRLDSSVSCSSATKCQLDPTNDLTEDTAYTICLIEGSTGEGMSIRSIPVKQTGCTSGICYADGTPFEGVSVDFRTITSSPNPAPVIVSLVDANPSDNDNNVSATGKSGVYFSSFDVTFSEAMNDASVTTVGNITLTCESDRGTQTPTIAIALNSGSRYTITVTDAYLYQLLPCTLAFTTNITDSDGVALASAATYQFTNGCATDDHYDADTSSCWTVVSSGGQTYSNWTDLKANVYTFDTLNSVLTYNPSVAETDLISKTVTFNDGGFEMEIHFSAILGFTLTNDYLVLGVYTDDRSLFAGVTGIVGVQQCFVSYMEGGQTQVTNPCPVGSEYCIKVKVESGTSNVRAWFATDANCTTSTYTDAGDLDPTRTLPNPDTKILDVTTTWTMQISSQDTTGPVANIEKILTDGVDATGQY